MTPNMVKKIVIISSIAAVACLLVFAGVFYFRNLRGIGPAISSPREKISEIIDTEKGPLTIPGDLTVSIFAKNLEGPRVMKFDPSGVLVVSIPSEGKVVALPDVDLDGKADSVITVAGSLNNPHGIAFRCEENDCSLYIAETNAVSVYDYDGETFKATGKKKIIDLPSGGGHFTRTIILTDIGGTERLLVSVGSSCNVCDESDERRAKILSANPDGSGLKIFASGLRNSVFMTLRPGTDEIWATEMGRDLLGDDVPPDEINIIREKGNYGWPICYGKNIHDTNFDHKTYFRAPCMEPLETGSLIDIPAHSAPLGLAFAPEEWPEEYRGDLFVALHGSWNRSVPTGYKIVRYDLVEGRPSGQAEDLISGWLADGNAFGRPVDIIFGSKGQMFVTDDKSGVVYRISPKK